MATDRSTDRLRAGLRVQDSDGEPIGEIAEVWPDVGVGESWGSSGALAIEGAEAADPARSAYSEAMPGEGESYFRVSCPSGGDLYVPFSYVAEVRDDAAILAIAAEEVPHMQWDVRPDFLHEDTGEITASEGGGQPK